MRVERFPEELLSATSSRYYLHTYREIESWLEKTVYPSGKPRPFKKVTFMFTEEQLIMARTRGAKNNAQPSNQNRPANNGGGSNVRWVNVSLDSDDTAFLAEATTSFSELAAMACEYVTNGYSLTIKPMDGGDSVMACIIGKPSEDQSISVGLSGFAANVRDALLVLCYKLEDKLGGQLPVPDGTASIERARFR